MEKAWAAGILHITFTGGEPTLREDLPDLIAHGREDRAGHRLADGWLEAG